jgi:hypothetical protein
MWNFRRKEKTPKQKDFVIYKKFKPARILAVDRKGRTPYFLISWDNLTHRGQAYQKWVKAELCTQYIPPGKKTLYQEIYGEVRNLTWFQKLIVKLKNWWYGKD